MNYEFHPAAEAEFLESVAFYESRVPGLGNAFIDEVQVVIDLICEAPAQWQIVLEPDMRRAPRHRFPFSIVYRVKFSKAQLLAVAHNNRRPQYWLGRF